MLKRCRVGRAYWFCGIMGEGLAEKGGLAEGIEKGNNSIAGKGREDYPGV